MSGDRDDDIQVRYRFDDKTPSGFEYWGLSTSSRAALHERF